ncbi:MAG: hypothetical protein M3069_00695, partial [Chloroflexota bacterium]|nr:hypothetical protein [Chloroflexota bacterium]
MSTFRNRPRPFALALLLVVVLSVALPLALAAMERLGAQPGAVAPTVPDTLLTVQWPSQSRSPRQFLTGRRVAALEPTSLTPRPIIDGTQQPVVSPDGRELFFVRYQEIGDVVRVDLVTLTSDSLVPRWTANVATLSAAEVDQPNGMSPANLAIAATGDSVYVARPSVNAAPLEIAVLDRANGAEQARWHIDLGRPAASVNLFADARSGFLDVLAIEPGNFGPTTGPPLTVVRLQ